VAGPWLQAYTSELYAYLGVLENRLFSEGLHVLGAEPTAESAAQYLSAYFGEKLSEQAVEAVAGMQADDSVDDVRAALERSLALPSSASSSDGEGEGEGVGEKGGGGEGDRVGGGAGAALAEAVEIRALLRRNVEELSGAMKALNGEYLLPAVGGDLLRDGPGVLPTGRACSLTACSLIARAHSSHRRVLWHGKRDHLPAVPVTAYALAASCDVVR